MQRAGQTAGHAVEEQACGQPHIAIKPANGAPCKIATELANVPPCKLPHQLLRIAVLATWRDHQGTLHSQTLPLCRTRSFAPQCQDDPRTLRPRTLCPPPHTATLWAQASRTWFLMSHCASLTMPRRFRHVVSGRVPLSASSHTVGHSGDKPSVTSLHRQQGWVCQVGVCRKLTCQRATYWGARAAALPRLAAPSKGQDEAEHQAHHAQLSLTNVCLTTAICQDMKLANQHRLRVGRMQRTAGCRAHRPAPAAAGPAPAASGTRPSAPRSRCARCCSCAGQAGESRQSGENSL